MDAFNRAFCKIFDVFFYPFVHLPPLWGLLSISVLTGLLMLFIFRYTSNQEGIRRVKDRIKAHFFEIRLFKDDLGLMLEAQKKILKLNLTYMKHSLKPMAVLIIPVVLIMIQVGVRFDRSPLEIGESAILKIKYEDSASFQGGAAVSSLKGIRVETDALRVFSENEMNWRIKALEEGVHEVDILLRQGPLRKTVSVGSHARKISPLRVSGGLLDRLIYPSEKGLPDDWGIDYVKVEYPAVNYSILGLDLHWLVIFFVVSIATGFALKRIFRVEV